MGLLPTRRLLIVFTSLVFSSLFSHDTYLFSLLMIAASIYPCLYSFGSCLNDVPFVVSFSSFMSMCPFPAHCMPHTTMIPPFWLTPLAFIAR